MITSLEFKDAVASPVPTNHVFVVDVSYSMGGSLPSIRKHLKSNLAQLVKPKDTVSILFFASKGQFGTVFAGEPVHDLKDLSKINSAIDRYLIPIGCTGFVEPLALSFETASSIQNGNINSLVFMTDGYDNQWSDSQILEKASNIRGVYESVTIIEYGYYCNRELLEKMAISMDAHHVFAEGYAEFEPKLDEALSSTTSKRIKIDVPDGTEWILFLDSGRLCNQVVDQKTTSIPEHVKQVWAVHGEIKVDEIKDIQQLYVILFYATQIMSQDLAWQTLQVLGDVYLIKKYSNCFTKQDYSEIKADIEAAVISEDKRFVEGINYDLVPDEDAFTTLDLLKLLSDSDALLIYGSPYFQYSRIGKAAIQREDNTIDVLAEQMGEAKTKEERKQIASKMVNAVEWTPEFIKTSDEPLPMHDLVYNESRPNVSVRTTTNGKVAIPKEIREEYPTLPDSIDTIIYRNYTIIKDGIINLKTLPVRIPVALYNKLESEGVKLFAIGEEVEGLRDYAIDLMSVPVVNRAMVNGLNAEEFFQAHLELQRNKALTKVLKFYREELIGKVNALGLATQYGSEAAYFLSQKGIRDYGFSPAVDVVKGEDSYFSKELNVKIAGLSSLPSVPSVLKKIKEKKKLNVADLMIKDGIDYYLGFIESPVVSSTKTYETLVANWIKDESHQSIQATRKIQLALSKLVYGVVAGHGWFEDLDFENPTMVINNQGVDYTVTASLEQKEVKI